MNIQVCNIVTIKSESARYRIIAILGDSIILCRLDTTKFDLIEITKSALFSMINENAAVIESNNTDEVFDFSTLDDSNLEKYQVRLNIMNEVLKCYGPDYIKLTGKKNKDELKSILARYNFNKVTFWRMCTRYFQSGFDNKALLDERVFGYRYSSDFKYSTKTGRKGEYGEVGIALTPEVLSHFEEALNEYKSGRQKTIKSVFEHMSMLHYSKNEVINGVTSIVLLPPNERPTYKQFYNYVHKHLTSAEKDIIKTSQMEFRNNKRLLTSDSLYGVNGPGDLVEIDACEADVSLVSMTDPNQTVGRPIVYFMIDVYTRIILAMSVAFDNNSLLGVTNLFLNLCDNKKEYCERYGMSYSDDRLWPSNIIPNRIRLDRGSEFKSKEFGRICNALGIQKDIVPGGSGSLKGVVEQSFHLMHLNQNEMLEDHGLIEKRHDSNHQKEATLNIEQYTKMVINFVLTHNQKYQEGYPLTKVMLDKGVKAIPAALWQYGIENISTPRPILNKNQYLYELMAPIKVSVSRKGISYKGLTYSSDDPGITTLMFRAKTKSIPIEARMDMRDVGFIYVLKNGVLIQIPLNERAAGNVGFNGMTMKQYEDYRKLKGQQLADGRIYNEELTAFSQSVNKTIVKEASKSSETQSNDKNMRPAREIEKQRVSSENTIKDRFDGVKKAKKLEEKPLIEEKTSQEPPKDFFNLTKEELLEEQRKALEAFDDED